MTAPSGDSIRRLLHPKSVALVGASGREGKAGYGILKKMLSWKGDLFCVHPREKEIMGRRVISSVRELPEGLDLAVIALGAADTVEAAAQCAEMGVGVVIPIAGGFSETGAEGKKLEEELRRRVVDRGTRVLGPNSMGVIMPGTGLDTIFVEHDDPLFSKSGDIAFITQSGSLGTEVLAHAGARGWGLRAWVGLGNRIDVAEHELIEHFAGDEATHCLLLYLETLADGRAFMEACRRHGATKPIVVLRAGRGPAASRAVASHTGRMAGGNAVFAGAARQAGIHLALDEEDLVDFARVLAREPVPAGPAVGVLSSAGGFAVITTDLIEETPLLEPAKFSKETVRRLADKALPFASIRNPIDLTGSATDDMMAHALACLEDDPGVNVILAHAFFGPPGLTDGQVEVMAAHRKRTRKPFIVYSLRGKSTDENARAMYDRGVTAVTSLRSAVRSAKVLVERAKFLARGRDAVSSRSGAERFHALKSALSAGAGLDEFEVKRILVSLGLSVPEGARLPSDQEGRVDTPGFDGPYAVKVLDPSVLHKTERGGVRLDVEPAHLGAAIEDLRARFPGMDLLIEKMVRREGIEVIAGALRDESLGPVVMVGMGGLFTEVYGDRSFAVPPLDETEVEDMLGALKAHALLEGSRGFRACRSALVDLVITLGDLALELDEESLLGEIDLNPVLVTRDGAVILDATISRRSGVKVPGGAGGGGP